LVLTTQYSNVNSNLELGGYTEEVTPGPIPNPEVKLFKADDTALVREWESR
jgi:hypothetical protein